MIRYLLSGFLVSHTGRTEKEKLQDSQIVAHKDVPSCLFCEHTYTHVHAHAHSHTTSIFPLLPVNFYILIPMQASWIFFT